MVSIVIPVYNALECARECLDAVYRAQTRVPFEAIVVNNGSAPEVAAWLAAEQLRRRDLRVLTFEQPLGFARAVNEGARVARFGFLLVLNSDTILADGCLDGLTGALEADPRLGIASPVTNHSGPGPQLVSAPPPEDGPSAPIYEPQRLFFYCVLIRRELWEELHGLDEIYQVGTFEDDDFCLRARMAGWSLAVLPNVYVRNHASRTFRENRIDRERWMNRNREIFLDRAARLSREPAAASPGKRPLPAITVVVPVPGGGSDGLPDSLRSLANQTVTGFETILAAADRAALPRIPDDWPGSLRLTTVIAPDARTLQELMEAGSAAAHGAYLSYLPAGDLYYPFHLEVLYEALRGAEAAAACTACRSPGTPPVCWMRRRAGRPEKTGSLALPRVTCELGARSREIDAGRRQTGERARRLLLNSLAAKPDAPAIPRPAGLPDVFLFNIVGWEGLVQRPHHFARGLAERGYRVFWIDVRLVAPGSFRKLSGPRKLAENLFHLQLPGFEGDIYHLPWRPEVLELMLEAMEHVRRVEGVGRAVQMVNFPGWTPLAGGLRRRFGWPILYDCLDDQKAFGELYGQQTTAEYEAELTGICDVLVTSGLTLYEAKRPHHPNTMLIPNAADYALFHQARSCGLLDRLPKPVVGFFGAFADWLDLDWVSESARRFPAWSFVYIGSEGFARPENRARWISATAPNNIHVLPRADPARLASYLAQFDVCTMPFQDLPITRSMHAVKIYEYLAAGKHVLAPALPEMRGFADEGLVFTYETREQSFGLLETLAMEPPTADQAAARQAFAARHTWSRRLDQLTRAIEGLSPASAGPGSAA